MKVVTLASLSIVFFFGSVSATERNTTVNGEFAEGRKGWSVWQGGGARMTVDIDDSVRLSGKHSMRLNVTRSTPVDWHLQLWASPFTPRKDAVYRLGFQAVASKPVSIQATIRPVEKPRSVRWAKGGIRIGTSPQWFTIDDISLPLDREMSLKVFLSNNGPCTLWLDSVSLVELVDGSDDGTPLSAGPPQPSSPQIPLPLPGRAACDQTPLTWVLKPFDGGKEKSLGAIAEGSEDPVLVVVATLESPHFDAALKDIELLESICVPVVILPQLSEDEPPVFPPTIPANIFTHIYTADLPPEDTMVLPRLLVAYESMGIVTDRRGWGSGLSDVLSSAASQTLRHGLVGEWLLNGNAEDTSGAGKHGKPVLVKPAKDRFQVKDQAYTFAGPGVYLDLGMLEIGPQLTVCLWAKAASPRQGQRLLVFQDDAGGDIMLAALRKNARFVFLPRANTEFVRDTFVVDQWVFVCVTVDADGSVSLWKDGQEQCSFDIKPIAGKKRGTMAGNDPFERNRWFNGCLDDIRIYNRVLAEPEIQALYHEGGWDAN